MGSPGTMEQGTGAGFRQGRVMNDVHGHAPLACFETGENCGRPFFSDLGGSLLVMSPCTLTRIPGNRPWVMVLQLVCTDNRQRSHGSA